MRSMTRGGKRAFQGASCPAARDPGVPAYAAAAGQGAALHSTGRPIHATSLRQFVVKFRTWPETCNGWLPRALCSMFYTPLVTPPKACSFSATARSKTSTQRNFKRCLHLSRNSSERPSETSKKLNILLEGVNIRPCKARMPKHANCRETKTLRRQAQVCNTLYSLWYAICLLRGNGVQSVRVCLATGSHNSVHPGPGNDSDD